MQESEGVLCMRVSFRIALAGQVIGVSALYEQTRTFCKNYLTDAPASFEVAVTPADIAYERQRSARADELEGAAVREHADPYLETLAVYRKLAQLLVQDDILLMHGAVVAVDGQAYLFTAKSGTGKTTHTRLWMRQFGDRAVMVNGDKPLLHITSEGVTVYGTPWDGKEHLSTNTSCPLKALCILTRSETNHIERISKKEALPMLCQQSYRPCSPIGAQKMLALVDRLGQQRAAVPAGLQHGTGGRTCGLPRNEPRIEETHMQTILPPSGNTIKILGKARSAEQDLRWMTYVLAQPVEGGVLVFHTLTRALLLLTPEEYAAPDNLPELRDGWFRVPQEMNDQKYADQVRFIRRTMWKEPEHTTTYTIFTTTDCNARCFYCYEMGRSRIPMSAETAHKAAAYIAAHCGDEKVHLHWFGGEPLFNKQVIDIICTDLAEKGIVYESMMISNGYLFDGATVEQAVSHWKLKSVQITLDGTEEIYNRSKAFIYKDSKSPYQVVLANIQRLLDAGVSVHIRLNMDEHNADNLMELADELHERFGGKGKFSVYSHTLFEFAGSKAHIRAQEERRQLYQKQQRLRKKLDDCGIGASYYLRQKLRIRQCMADSGGSLTILPNGELGLCEHYSEDNFVGSLDGKASERSVIQSFREYWEPIEACKTCFYYPECIRLKKCAEQKECFEELRAEYKEHLLKSMQKTYNAWLKKEQIDEEEPHPDC